MKNFALGFAVLLLAAAVILAVPEALAKSCDESLLCVNGYRTIR